MSVDTPPSREDLDRTEQRIEDWTRAQVAANPAVVAVERGEPGERRWYVRLRGESRDVFTVWLTLRQRTLRYETYFMPAPVTNSERLYAHLLRRNDTLRGLRFAIGDEEAIFLVGEMEVASVGDTTLDRMLGGLYATTEQNFVTAMRIGYEGKFRPASGS